VVLERDVHQVVSQKKDWERIQKSYRFPDVLAESGGPRPNIESVLTVLGEFLVNLREFRRSVVAALKGHDFSLNESRFLFRTDSKRISLCAEHGF
jgi:hypothetical protein